MNSVNSDSDNVRNNTWSTPYKFNGKELDEETGLAYYHARYYDPRTSVWLSVDPLAEKMPGFTSYHYCSNNPVMRIDPDGKHDFTVSNDGIITEKNIRDGNHRYFDINGNQLTFNDANGADSRWLTSHDIAVGDRLYMNISNESITKAVGSVSQNPSIVLLRKLGLNNLAYALIGVASWNDADFTFSFLVGYYDENRNQESEVASYIFSDRDRRSTFYQEDFVNFRFGESNTLYNLYDSGNFIWGVWSKGIGLADFEVWAGSTLNEIFQLRFGDSKAGQKAIYDGRKLKRK